MTRSSARVVAADIFCGAGGLTRGLLDAGVDVRKGVDIDDQCTYAYQENNGVDFVQKDARNVSGRNVRAWLEGGHSLLAGCAPCQPFSILTNGRSRETTQEYGLLTEFSRLIKEAHPDYVTMENVPGLTATSVFDDFVDGLVSDGYAVNWSVVDCNAFGVPQSRRRLVLLASKRGDAPSLKRQPGPRPAAGPILRSTRPLTAGGRDERDSLHRATRLSDRNLERIRESRPGGTWRDWPTRLRLDCHQKPGGEAFDQVYGRINPDGPAPTITTKFFNYGSGRFGHPRDDRALTPREAALLQTFPRSYDFERESEPLGFTDLGRLIGNAVPVRLAHAVGRAVLEHAASA